MSLFLKKFYLQQVTCEALKVNIEIEADVSNRLITFKVFCDACMCKSFGAYGGLMNVEKFNIYSFLMCFKIWIIQSLLLILLFIYQMVPSKDDINVGVMKPVRE